MANIKCKKCKNVYEAFKDIEIAEEKHEQIIQENEEPRLQYFRAPHYCSICKVTEFYIDEEEVMQNLTRLGNLEEILQLMVENEIEITQELSEKYESLFGMQITEDLKSEIDTIVKRYVKKEEEEQENE